MVKSEVIIKCFILLLGSKGYVTARKIADKLGVCQRTAYRYMDTLSLAVPIECNRGGGGNRGFRIMPDYRKELKRFINYEDDL